MGVGAAAAGDSSEAGGYRNGVNLSTVNATLAEDTAIQPEDPSRTPGKNDRTGTAGSLSAMRRALLPGNNTVVLPYAVNDSDGLPLYLLQPDVTTQPVQEVQEVPEPIRVVQEPTGAVQGPIGIFQGNEGSELFRFLNR